MPEIQLDHIAIAMPRMAEAPAFLVGVLGGIPYWGRGVGVFRFGQWRFDGGGRIEILEPRGEDGFLHRFVAARGAGIHHVTFKVPDLREVCDRAEAAGYGIVGYNDTSPSWKEAFLHPKQALGIVVQFAESAFTGEPLRPWVAPPGPDDPPPPVRLLGLRTRVASLERARVQWETVLQGRPEEAGDGGVIYRWPESPLRIAVDVAPSLPEGPVCIELTSDRSVGLVEGPHPVMGAAFVQRPEGTR